MTSSDLALKRLGVESLPNGWSIHELASLVKQDKPIVYGIVQAGPYVADGVPYITSTDVRGTLHAETLQKTSHEIANRYQRSVVSPGDIVFSLRGNIGERCIVPTHLKVANLTQGTARISIGRENSTSFFYQAIEGLQTQRQIYLCGKGSTFKEISLEELRKLLVLCPQLPEQRKIAAILSTWDRAIELTEKLIAAKQRRKQALMQRLLTGKVRLPGFQSEEFATVRLDELAKSKPGNGKLIKGKQSSVPSKGLFQAYSASGPDAWVPEAEFDGAGVVVSAVGARCGKAFYASGKWTAIANTHVLIPTEKSVAKFVWLLVNNERFWIKGGSAQPFVKISASMKIKVQAPSVEYQRALVAFAEAAEHELNAMTNKLGFLREQKRGLMQQLLTGKIRVNVDEPAAEVS